MIKRITILSGLLFFSLIGFGQKSVRVEKEISFVYEGDTLQGTLLSSGKNAKKYSKLPLVVFISGSGPTDRNGNSLMVEGKNNSFLQLADSLLKLGVASFRYDKLGIGASQMSKTEEELRFDDNAEVALKAISTMKEQGFKKIVIAGHSEGSLVGMLAAQKADIKGYISLAGPAQNALEVLKGQLYGNLGEEMAKTTFNKLDSIKQGYTITKFNPALGALLRPSVQPYLKSFFTYTPSEEIQKISIPVMIIQGGMDLQVLPAEGEALHKAVPNALYKLYANMNHVLKKVDNSREQNIAAYTDADFPLVDSLALDMASWIKEL